MKRRLLAGLLAVGIGLLVSCSDDVKDSVDAEAMRDTSSNSQATPSSEPTSTPTDSEGNPTTPREDAAAIHARALVLDAHADIEIPGQESRYVGKDGRSQVAPDKMRAGGVDAVVMAVAVSPGPRNEEGFAAARAQADAELAAILDMTSDPNDDLVLVRSADELVAAHAEGKQALILGFQNALSLGRDVSGLDAFFDAGVRVFALTHMGHNDFADSSRPLFYAELGGHEPEAEHGGLSELGVAAIARINDLGGLVDVSQLSKTATLQVLSLSRAPVIASHSNARGLTDVTRNLSDEELDAIGKNGGVVHVAPFRAYLFDSTDAVLIEKIRAARRTAGIREDYYYPFELYWEIKDSEVQRAFITEVSGLLGDIGIEEMIDHIDYIAERLGTEHVGIGTDFNHGSGFAGYEDASDAPNVTKALLARGYSAEDVENIWGGNFLRVFREAQMLAK